MKAAPFVTRYPSVMAELVPVIHVFFFQDSVRVDARDKPGHDGERG